MPLPFTLAWSPRPTESAPALSLRSTPSPTTDVITFAPEAFRTWVLRQHAAGAHDALAVVYPSQGDGAHLPPHLHRAHAVLVAPEATLDGLGTRFDRPLYAAGALVIPPYAALYGVYAEGDVTVGDGTLVQRWLSGTHVVIGIGCTLRGPVQGLETIIVDVATTFTRLQAPLLQFGGGRRGRRQPDAHRRTRVDAPARRGP